MMFVLIVLSLTACAHAPEKSGARLPKTAAKIGDTAVSRDQVLREAAPQLQKLREEQYNILKETIDRLVEKNLVETAAAKAGRPWKRSNRA